VLTVPRIPLAGGGLAPPSIAPPPDLAPRALTGESVLFDGWKDPRLAQFVSEGRPNHAGAHVNGRTALFNTAVFRAVTLISYAVGMLPFHLLEGEGDDTRKATGNPLFAVLHSRPNEWHTAFEFRAFMMKNALIYGDAYALVARGARGVLRLAPVHPLRVRIEQDEDTLAVRYRVGDREVPAEQMFHLRGLLDDNGLNGISLVRQASEAIGLAMQMEAAAGRAFRNGLMVGGFIEHPKRLGPDALKSLADSLEARYAGVENAHRWLVLEEGMKASKLGQTAEEAQHLEQRKHQIEEVGRVFGVPRPLLGMDETSWGTGIEQLSIGFVRYGLSPWFEAWQQAVQRCLLTDDERGRYRAKFNEGALLRGSLREQFEAFAIGLGRGGQLPFLHQDEVRAWLNMPARDDLGSAPASLDGGPDAQQPPP
jgi:HK97 family phage portal protein